MQPLLAMIEPIAMQHGIHVARAHAARAVALPPRGTKPRRILAPAVEAWTMPGCERGRFIEKEQFGPASLPHHLAPAAAEFADAGDPGGTRPALPEQGLGRRIVDDAAVAGEHPAIWRCDDVAGGRDAVLKRH